MRGDMTTTINEARIIQQFMAKIHTIEVLEQVRRKFDKNAHEELIASIRAKGVISPLTVRPNPDAAGRPYILVAGERRLRAALGAGLELVPVVVRDLDAQSAALYQVEENIHRRDLTAIEEARGFKVLLDARKFSVDQLSQLVDKSKGYVYRALSLLELPERALNAIEDGTLTAAHGHQLLRVPADEREAYVKDILDNGYDGYITTALELRQQIDQRGADLGNAKFPKDKPYAGREACSKCAFNSGNQGALFDGATKGTCTFVECFRDKEKQYHADFIEKVKAKHKTAAFVIRKGSSVWNGMGVNSGDQTYIVRGNEQPAGDYGVVLGFQNTVYYATKPTKAELARNAKSQDRGDYERDEVAREAFRQVFYKRYAEEAKKLTHGKDVLVDVVLELVERWSYHSKHVLAAWGWKKWDKNTLLKLSESELIGLAYVLGHSDESDAKRLGINLTAEIRKAKDAALKDYDAKKAKK